MTGIAWSKRLVTLLIVALLVAVTCVALGIWQIARLHQKQQFNAALTAGLESPAVPLERWLAGADDDTLRYRRVEAAGTYDVEHGFVLYGRTQDSQPGNHLLTPLRLPGGDAIIVDRGWVPLDVDSPGAALAAPPSGQIHVEGVLFGSEGGIPGDEEPTEAGATTISELDLAAIQARLPYPIAPEYLLLQAQSPAQTDGLPRPAPLPEPSEGPHRSYAVQWFTFAVIALVGFVVLARRESESSSATPEQVG
jgi:surfeit locus 1 family protein